MFTNFKKTNEEDNGQHWLSISDLMSGLMIVFVFIAIAMMLHTLKERATVKEIAVAYREAQVAIYESLMDEFGDDLSKWNAVIDEETLTFTFNSPEILFQVGSSDLNQDYKDLLTDFFPRYIKILDEFKNSIDEVRIEGHTSSIWNATTSDADAYFLNMDLSQGRTRKVLEYVYNLPQIQLYQTWVKKNIAAVGYSSAHPILIDNVENQSASQRVTFRVLTNSDVRIKQILETVE